MVGTMASVQPVPFGELLRRHRAAANLTQEELAVEAHISARAVSALETGSRRMPHRETISLLADALGLSPAERTLFAAAARQRVAALPRKKGPSPGGAG